jgi:hypothetical protein
MSHPSHPPWCAHPNDIWWRVQIMKLINMQFPADSYHFIALRSALGFINYTRRRTKLSLRGFWKMGFKFDLLTRENTETILSIMYINEHFLIGVSF